MHIDLGKHSYDKNQRRPVELKGDFIGFLNSKLRVIVNYYWTQKVLLTKSTQLKLCIYTRTLIIIINKTPTAAKIYYNFQLYSHANRTKLFNVSPTLIIIIIIFLFLKSPAAYLKHINTNFFFRI